MLRAFRVEITINFRQIVLTGVFVWMRKAQPLEAESSAFLGTTSSSRAFRNHHQPNHSASRWTVHGAYLERPSNLVSLLGDAFVDGEGNLGGVCTTLLHVLTSPLCSQAALLPLVLQGVSLVSHRRPPLAAPPPRAPLARPLPHPLELALPPTSLGGPRRAQAPLARPPAPPPLEVQAHQPLGAAHSEHQPSRAHLGRRQLRRPPLGHQRQVSCLGNCAGDASKWFYVLNVCATLAVLIRHCCRVLLFCLH
jgi:hypothetical protein